MKPAPRKKTGGRKSKMDPELVAASIVQHEGNLTHVAKEFCVRRSTVQEFISHRPPLQQILRDARESMKDEAESALHRAIRGGEAWAVCFFLKTQAKDRGYVERQEVDQTNRAKLQIVEEIVDAPPVKVTPEPKPIP